MTEPRRVRGVGGLEGLGSLGPDLGGGAVVDRRRRVVSDPGVAVLVAVVMWVILSRIGRPRCSRSVRGSPAVLEGLELRLIAGK